MGTVQHANLGPRRRLSGRGQGTVVCAAKRTKTKVTLVANQAMRTPRSEFVDSLLVPAGMNVADRRIVELVQPGDLVITADIPLAAQAVAKGGQALNPRGELYTEANVGERLAVRNLLDELRGRPDHWRTGQLQRQRPASVRQSARSLVDGGEGLNAVDRTQSPNPRKQDGAGESGGATFRRRSKCPRFEKLFCSHHHSLHQRGTIESPAATCSFW